jgi:hypothetical protein
MYMQLGCLYKFFVEAPQVISQAEAHGHQVMTFVPYFSAENLTTLIRYKSNDIVFNMKRGIFFYTSSKTMFTLFLMFSCIQILHPSSLLSNSLTDYISHRLHILLMKEKAIITLPYRTNTSISFTPYLASGSSRVSKFSQSVEIILSYLLGYLRNISLITTMASCTT